jgi:hypothetical protein
MTYWPVFLDGPWRGREVQVDSLSPFQVAMPKPVDVASYFNPRTDPPVTIDLADMADIYTYYFHKFKFGKRTIITASLNPAQPSMEDAFDLLFNDYAKRAEFHHD